MALETQTIIFSKEHFKTAGAALSWAKEHDFLASKVDEKEDHFRVRQIDPSRFDEKSFRTKEIDTGVQIVVGKLLDIK